MSASTPARSEETEVVVVGPSRTLSAVNSPGFFNLLGSQVEIVLSYSFLAGPSIVIMSATVLALARFLSLRYADRQTLTFSGHG